MNQQTLERTSGAAVACSAWLDGNPPKDGTPIVAIGRVIWRDEYSTSVDSFLAIIRWENDQSGYEGWHFDRDGRMTVARTLDDEVMVDWWLPMPSNEKLSHTAPTTT